MNPELSYRKRILKHWIDWPEGRFAATEIMPRGEALLIAAELTSSHELTFRYADTADDVISLWSSPSSLVFLEQLGHREAAVGLNAATEDEYANLISRLDGCRQVVDMAAGGIGQ